jgi:HAD superfamily hydrolase (TIGR01509 family)
MEGEDLLEHLLPREQYRQLKEWILNKHESRYRSEYLPQIRAFPGIRELFEAINAGGSKIALATPSRADELAHYRKVMNVDDLLDAVVCGDDVKRGKPRPDLVLLALRKLGVSPAETVAVGDTPSDAQAAARSRVQAIGMLSGLFSRADLLNAGCAAIFLDPKGLHQAFSQPVAA